jgi:hypothetical protein
MSSPRTILLTAFKAFHYFLYVRSPKATIEKSAWFWTLLTPPPKSLEDLWTNVETPKDSSDRASKKVSKDEVCAEFEVVKGSCVTEGIPGAPKEKCLGFVVIFGVVRCKITASTCQSHPQAHLINHVPPH